MPFSDVYRKLYILFLLPVSMLFLKMIYYTIRKAFENSHILSWNFLSWTPCEGYVSFLIARNTGFAVCVISLGLVTYFFILTKVSTSCSLILVDMNNVSLCSIAHWENHFKTYFCYVTVLWHNYVCRHWACVFVCVLTLRTHLNMYCIIFSAEVRHFS